MENKVYYVRKNRNAFACQTNTIDGYQRIAKDEELITHIFILKRGSSLTWSPLLIHTNHSHPHLQYQELADILFQPHH